MGYTKLYSNISKFLTDKHNTLAYIEVIMSSKVMYDDFNHVEKQI